MYKGKEKKNKKSFKKYVSFKNYLHIIKYKQQKTDKSI